MALDPITAVADLAGTVLDKFFPDANEEMKGRMALATAEIQNQVNIQLAQIQANTTEAAHPSIFVAGARPAIMWVGAFALAYSSIGISILNWIAAIAGLPLLPNVDVDALNNILLGLLGLGGMRTVEKVKGVSTNRVK